MTGRLDVHQHLWPAPLVEALRRRSCPPLLRGWTLHSATEPPYPVRPVEHDPARRRALERGTARALVSLSAPLGIEYLGPDEAEPLLTAWHAGVAELGTPFAGWAAVNHVEPNLDALRTVLRAEAGVVPAFVGLQIPATELATPAALERVAPVLRVCEQAGRPVLVHPGPSSAVPPGAPGWWAAVVDYPAQLQASWWSWQQTGRALLPDLRICFVAGAGLAPVHHERFTARSGERLVVDRNVFVETSSYGRQAVDALIRALGIDVIVLGSDRPYAEPFRDPHLGAAAMRAIEVDNPTRLLEGDQP